MFTNKLRLLLLYVSIISLTSCSDDEQKAESYGISTGDYFPMTENNVWRYYDGTSEKVVALGTTTNFNNFPYFRIFDSSITLNIENWIAKRGASYLQRTTETLLPLPNGGTAEIGEYEIVLLRDDLNVGETWSGTPSFTVQVYNGGAPQGIPASLTYTGTILERDGSLILDGTTYTNVIKMHMKVVEEVNSQITNIEADYWFAKDIGLIKESITSSTDNVTQTLYLTSYTLN